MSTPEFWRQTFRQPLLSRPERQEAPLPQLFAILNDKADRQILQVALSPASIAFIKATKIYSSGQIKTSKVANQRFSLISMISKEAPVEQLVNNSPSLKLLGIKHPTKSGPILILDLAAYRQDLYFNYDSLIASLKSPMERSKHPQLPLRLAEYKEKVDNIFDALDISQDVLVLQAQSVIVEKYLAAEEQFNLFERESLMALSKSVKVELAKGRGLKLKGPGWAFFQANSMEILNQRRGNRALRIIVYFSIVMALLQILLTSLL